MGGWIKARGEVGRKQVLHHVRVHLDQSGSGLGFVRWVPGTKQTGPSPIGPSITPSYKAHTTVRACVRAPLLQAEFYQKAGDEKEPARVHCFPLRLSFPTKRGGGNHVVTLLSDRETTASPSSGSAPAATCKSQRRLQMDD
jgi:hypothetical protein